MALIFCIILIIVLAISFTIILIIEHKTHKELCLYKESYPTIEELHQKINKLTEQSKQAQEVYDQHRIMLLAQADKDAAEIQYTIQQCVSTASNQYCLAIENTYNDLEAKFDSYKKHINERKQTLEDEITNAKEQLAELKNTISAGAQEQLRERQNKEKINFYKLVISDEDLADIHILNDVKSMMHTPSAIGKVIWSTYFQKKTTELCNRVVAPMPKKVCGIYKITNQVTQQCYLGQSVDISSRFKEHIKCGLGIDPPSANKLYQSMQQDGIWNFTFEVIEECDRSKLNEREAFWIEMFSSNLYGLNTLSSAGK